jgi:hypothetical protein
MVPARRRCTSCSEAVLLTAWAAKTRAMLAWSRIRPAREGAHPPKRRYLTGRQDRAGPPHALRMYLL